MEFHKFSSLENTYRQNIVDKIVYEGKNTGMWLVTEKLHGANFSFWCDGNEVKVASRTQFVDGTFFNCQKVINKHSDDILKFHNKTFPVGTVVSIYGELYGKGVQKEIEYGELRFSAFDVRVNGEPLHKVAAIAMIEQIGIKFSPIIHSGSFEECIQINNTFRSKETPEDFEGDNYAEGLVIEPFIPARFNNDNRIYLKNKSEKFTEKKTKTAKIPTNMTMPDEVTALLNDVSEYITENRVNNVISKIGKVTNKDFAKVAGLLVQDAVEDYEKDTENDLKHMVEDHWKKFAAALNREALTVARPVILGQIDV